MVKSIMKTLSNRATGKLKVHKDTVFWDRELTGFGVRVYPTGARVYIAQARGPEGPKRVAVGRHGVINAEEARKRAALIIARVKAGEEAVPEPMKQACGPTVAEVAARYLTEYVEVRCKPRTVKVVRSRPASAAAYRTCAGVLDGIPQIDGNLWTKGGIACRTSPITGNSSGLRRGMMTCGSMTYVTPSRPGT